MLKKAMGYDQSSSMEATVMNPGDVLDMAETEANNTTAGSTTLLGTDIATGIQRRTGPGGAFTDTLPTAQAILQALQGSQLAPGSSLFSGNALANLQFQYPTLAAQNLSQPGGFRWLYINTVAFTSTIAVNTGIITAGVSPLAVAASTWREYLVTIKSAFPPQSFTCNGANGAATLTGLTVDQCNQLQYDMSVTGTNIAANARIIGVNAQAGTVTLSGNNTGLITAGIITFTPTIEFRSLRSGTL